MISFSQFLDAPLNEEAISRLNDHSGNKSDLSAVRRALRYYGFVSDNAEFAKLNLIQSKIDFADLYKNRATYRINPKIKNIHIVCCKKALRTTAAVNKNIAAVYRVINPSKISQGQSPLYKLIHHANDQTNDQPQSVRIEANKVEDELSQWDFFYVVTTLGVDKNADKAKEEQPQQQTEEQPKEQPQQQSNDAEQNDANKQDEQQQGNKDEKQGDSEKDNKASKNVVDLGEYVNSFRDRIAKIDGYKLVHCYMSKTDGTPHVQVISDEDKLGSVFVDFSKPLVKGGKLTFKFNTITLSAFMNILKSTASFQSIASLLGVGTKDPDVFYKHSVRIGEALKDVATSMQNTAEVAQILSEIEVKDLPRK